MDLPSHSSIATEYLIPPQSPTYALRLRHVIVVTIGILLLILTVNSIRYNQLSLAERQLIFWFIPFALLVNTVALSILRRGYQRTASNLIVGTGFLFISGGALLTGGIHSPLIYVYTLIVAVAMFFLPRRLAWLATYGSAIFILAVFIAQYVFGLGLEQQEQIAISSAVIPICILFLLAIIFRIVSQQQRQQLATFKEALAKQAYQNTKLIQQQAASQEKINQKEQAIEIYAMRQRRLMETAPEAFLLVDGNTRQFLEVNEKACQIFGMSQEELLQSTIASLSPAAQPNGSLAHVRTGRIKRALEGQDIQFEWTFVDKEERQFPAEVHLTRFSSNPPIVRCSIFDVTERQRTVAAFVASQKAEGVVLFAGGVAHDFNNLMAIVLAQSEAATHYLDAQNQMAHHHIDQAIVATKKAKALTQQLLMYAGRAPSTTGPIELNSLIKENVTLFAAGLPKSIVLNYTLEPKIPFIMADSAQLQQIIMNLLINAADAMPNKEGWVELSTHTVVVRPEDRSSWSDAHLAPNPDFYVELRVRDNGSGMDELTRAILFDPFYTTKDEGTGLGLAAVHGIMRSLNGGLAVESEQGVGTTFRLLFRATSELLATSPQAKPIAKHSLESVRILIIDDEQMVLESLRDILRLHGINSDMATGGAEGLEFLRMNASATSLVLLDLSMPGIDGAQTLAHLRNFLPEMPVILSSGYSKRNVDQLLKQHEHVAFLHKPYSSKTLLAKITEMLAHKS